MIKGFFATDAAYKEMRSRYTAVDGLLAIGLWMLVMGLYYAIGVVAVRKHIVLGIPANFLLMGVCLLLVLGRGQKLASIGVTGKKLGKSLLLGAVAGVVLSFLMNVLPNLIAGGKVIPVGKAIYNVFYYFVVIGLAEEIIFRGYIQTRIYGLIKKDVPAIAMTGVLFYAMHLPYQMPVNGMQLSLVNFAIMFALHIVMNFLHRKYNSLAAPTVFHGLLDWGGALLR